MYSCKTNCCVAQNSGATGGGRSSHFRLQDTLSLASAVLIKKNNQRISKYKKITFVFKERNSYLRTKCGKTMFPHERIF
jgi:hypothetical protein